MRRTSQTSHAVGPQVIFGLDQSGVCTLSVGPGLEDLGVRPHELEGQDMFSLYEDDPVAVTHLRQVLSGDSFTVEREFGGRILSVFYQPVRDAAGHVTGAFGVSTDVTDQRRTEAEARVSSEHLRLLGDLVEDLTREVLDLSATLRVAVSSITTAAGEVGVIWLRTPTGDLLEPRATCQVDGEVTTTADSRVASRLPQSLGLSEAGPLDRPRTLDLDAAAGSEQEFDDVLARAAKRAGLRTALRVPLRSRGHLLGMVDLARGRRHGAFNEKDVELVTAMAERCALALDNALLLEAERESREELVKFQALADASGDLIGITDNEGRIAYANPRVLEYGLEVVELDAWRTLARYTGEATTSAIRGALETVGRWSGDVALEVPDLEVVAQLDVFPLSHPDTGAALGTAWIGRDVTELRSAESALRAANTELMAFKALVDASPDFIGIATIDGTVQYINPSGRKLIGIAPDTDVTATTMADYATPEAWRTYVEQIRSRILARGHWEGETTLRDHRGGPGIQMAAATFFVDDPRTGEPFAIATVQRDITERLAAETALRELADQRQALLTRLVDAQDDERARIAADVHDDPVQACAAIDLRLGMLKRQLRERAPELLDGVEALQSSLSGATDRLRALLFDLEPPDLEQGLTSALYRAAAEIFEGSQTRWTVDGDREPDVPDATRAVAYRIAKEAMVNARKHAAARHVRVTVTAQEGGLEVSVEDDGRGLGGEPATSRRGHRGLSSMRDRAAVAGGTFQICDREEGGTQATVWLPGPNPAP